MRLGLIAAAFALVALAGVSSAEARPFYEETGYGVASWGSSQRVTGAQHRTYGRAYRGRNYAASRRAIRYGGYQTSGRRYGSGAGVGGRPRAWCGWWMRTQKGGGPEYNLAANWRRWGSASGAQVGAVVVWPHHVGMITGRSASGQWIVKSGNDGGAVRERARSVSGATFRIG